MKKIFLSSTLFIFSIMNSQSKIEIPKEYELQTIPKYNSEEYRKLNYSEDISIKLAEKNSIVTFKTPRKKASELKFNNGLLIGTDHGEWGGKLSFKTDENEIEIKDGNIFSVFELKGDIYFIQGLAHGSINYGEIYKLEYSNNKFNYKKVIELPDEPEVFTIINDKIYIATFEHFLIIKDWNIEYKVKGFWDSLYPNSLIVENGNVIYIGIRGGIVRININENDIKLYTKK